MWSVFGNSVLTTLSLSVNNAMALRVLSSASPLGPQWAVSRTCLTVSSSVYFSAGADHHLSSRLRCVFHSTASVGVTVPVTLDDGPSMWLLGMVWTISPCSGMSCCSTGGRCSSVTGTSVSGVCWCSSASGSMNPLRTFLHLRVRST